MKKILQIVCTACVSVAVVYGLAYPTWVSNQPASSGINFVQALDYTRNNLMHIYNGLYTQLLCYVSSGTYYEGMDTADQTNIFVKKPFISSAGAPTTNWTKTTGEPYIDTTNEASGELRFGIYNATTSSYEYFSTGAAAGVDGFRYLDDYASPTYSFQNGNIQIATTPEMSASQATGSVTTVTLSYDYHYDYQSFEVQAVSLGDMNPPSVTAYGADDASKVWAMEFNSGAEETINWLWTIPYNCDLTKSYSDAYPAPVMLFADAFVTCSGAIYPTATYNIRVTTDVNNDTYTGTVGTWTPAASSLSNPYVNDLIVTVPISLTSALLSGKSQGDTVAIAVTVDGTVTGNAASVTESFNITKIDGVYVQKRRAD